MDPNLQFILDSITCLEWPGSSDEKSEASFWTRLELSMPKNKQRDEQEYPVPLLDYSSKV